MATTTITSDRDASGYREGYVRRHVLFDPPDQFYVYRSSVNDGITNRGRVGFRRYIDATTNTMEWRPCWRFEIGDAIDWSLVTGIRLQWWPITKSVFAGHAVTEADLRFAWSTGDAGTLWSLESADSADYAPAGMVYLSDCQLSPAEWVEDGLEKAYRYDLTAAELATVIAAADEWLFVQPRLVLVLPDDTGFAIDLGSGGAKSYERPAVIITETVGTREAVCRRFRDEWGSRTAYAFENERFQPPQDAAWVRVSVRHARGRQEVLGPAGARIFERRARITAQVFGLRDAGTAAIDALCQAVRDVFEGARFEGVECLEAQGVDVGNDGPWDQKNVEVSARYFETK